MNRFFNLGVIKNKLEYDESNLNDFKNAINQIKESDSWDKRLIERISRYAKFLIMLTKESTLMKKCRI